VSTAAVGVGVSTAADELSIVVVKVAVAKGVLVGISVSARVGVNASSAFESNPGSVAFAKFEVLVRETASTSEYTMKPLASITPTISASAIAIVRVGVT
jgi:hypothetical protein